MEGEISFSIRGERVAVLAPAYIDFILVSNRWSDIKTNAAFKGRLILSDKIFFKKTIDNIRFNFSEVIYWCAQKPFVSFGDEESERMILLTDLLIDIINKPDHHFCEETQKDFFGFVEHRFQAIQDRFWQRKVCVGRYARPFSPSGADSLP